MIVTLNLTFVMVGATPCGRDLGNVNMLLVSTGKSVILYVCIVSDSFRCFGYRSSRK